jgi:DNA (cytosine-5)-methyltransferase 1
MQDKHGNGNGHGPLLAIEALSLMPTPNTMDHLPARTPEQKAANKGKGGYANVRETVVNDLLPTPVTTDHKQNDSPAAWDRHSPQMGTIVHSTDWGKFQPAIERWEQVLGRPAPAPTKPDGKDGAHRLSSAFTEWMMGLPDGWITSVGLTRNEELKACGNGVVPQQAELALRILLHGIAVAPNATPVMPTLTTNGTGRHSAGYDSLGTLQMLEVAKGILPKEYDSWDQINGKIPEEWRDGKANLETGGGD